MKNLQQKDLNIEQLFIILDFYKGLIFITTNELLVKSLNLKITTLENQIYSKIIN